MWFRNLLIYRLAQDIPLGAEALEAALAAKPASFYLIKSIQPYVLTEDDIKDSRGEAND